jgi:glutamate dehydrogenase/leucine dehydrogenase
MRCLPDIQQEEVQLLARAMSYKYAFFKIEQGGAKAGLRFAYDEPTQRRRLLIREAARHFEPLVRKGVWSPWSDMNFTRDDLSEFYQAIGMARRPSSNGGSSFRTAVSAFAALAGSSDHLGIELSRIRIAIEGYGSVAGYLTSFLKRSGVKLVALTDRLGGIANPNGIDLNALEAHVREGRPWHHAAGLGKAISNEELFDIETDIFIPCARVHSLDEDRAGRLPTQLVLPIANVPCTEKALEVLDRRGIPFVPDYVVNGGGVCGNALSNASSERMHEADPFIRAFRKMILRLIRSAQAQGVAPRRLTDQVAEANFLWITSRAYDQPSLSNRFAQRMERLPGLARLVSGRQRRERARQTMELVEQAFA